MLETLQQLDQQLLLTLNGLHSPYWDSFMWLFTGRFILDPDVRYDSLYTLQKF